MRELEVTVDGWTMKLECCGDDYWSDIFTIYYSPLQKISITRNTLQMLLDKMEKVKEEEIKTLLRKSKVYLDGNV